MLDDEEAVELMDTSDPNAGRFVRYCFSPGFLNLKTIGATYVKTMILYQYQQFIV